MTADEAGARTRRVDQRAIERLFGQRHFDRVAGDDLDVSPASAERRANISALRASRSMH